MDIIKVKGLKKRYKSFERGHSFTESIKSLFKRNYVYKDALKGISFSIKKGEIVGFIGPNGAGKSTTIKVLIGVLQPDAGKVEVMGYNPQKERETYVKYAGVLFGQKGQVWWDIPAIDSFYLMKDIYEIPEKEFKERLDYMVKLLGMEDVTKRPVRSLSLGERMKCEFIATFLHNPSIVFLDEPTIGVDVRAKEKIRQFLLDINKKYETTILLASHDVGDIEKLCKRVIVIDDGKLIYDGNLQSLRKKYFNTKNITVKFVDQKKAFSMRGVKVTASEEDYVRLVIDLSKVKMNKVMDAIVSNYDIVDLDVAEPGVEDVIKKIYGEKH